MNKRYEKHLIIYSLLAGLIGLYLLYLVTNSESLWIDKVIASVFDTSNEALLTFSALFTQLGSKSGIVSAGLITIFFLWYKKKDYAGMATVALAIGLGNEVNKLLKNSIGRQRPELEHLDLVESLSFPSGHAMVGIIMYMLIGYFLVKYIPSSTGKWAAVITCSIIILFLGISRIILNVHFPTDVIAGFAFGFIWAVMWILIYEKLKNWTEKRS